MTPSQQHHLRLLQDCLDRKYHDPYAVQIQLYARLKIEGKTALMFAAESGALDLVRDLVTLGDAPLDETNDGIEYDSDSEETGYLVQGYEAGYSALMYACEEGHKDIAKFLIHSGADCWLSNARKKTALDLARISRHPEIVALFPERKQENFFRSITGMLSAPFCIAYPLSGEAKDETATEMTALKTVKQTSYL